MCQPMVMMFVLPFQAELTSTIGPGSRKRRTFSTGKSRLRRITLCHALVGELLAGVIAFVQVRQLHSVQDRWDFGKLNVAILDHLDTVSPGIEKVEEISCNERGAGR